MRATDFTSMPIREAVVESLDGRGRGVVRYEGRGLALAGALPGERVRYQAIGRRGRVSLVEVLEPSPHRVAPGCSHFEICGACALQHLAPAQQRRLKERRILKELGRHPGLEAAEVLAPVTGPQYGYRRRARLGVRHVPKKGKVLVGFRERGGRYVAELDRCEVLDARVGTLLSALGELIGGLTLFERIPQIEVAVGDTDGGLVFRVLDAPSAADGERLRRFAAEHGITVYLQPGGPESVVPLDPTSPPLGYWLEEGELQIRFMPTDFTQVNGALNRALVRRVLALLELDPTDRVLDLFCGLGNFTLPIARRVSIVTGVEGDEALVLRARDNAALNGVDNARFVAADLNLTEAEAAERGGWAEDAYDKVLLDPPRTGARAALAAVVGCGASRIVYVSCNPVTLADDAAVLVQEHGWQLTGVGVADMFPHTNHVESIALFTST